MTYEIKRTRKRHSVGGHWTEDDREELWNDRNLHSHLSWKQYMALDRFPGRSKSALEKQYSDIGKEKKRARKMAQREVDTKKSLKNLRVRKRPAPAEEAPEERSPKHERPAPLDEDGDTDSDAGDVLFSGEKEKLCVSPRKPMSVGRSLNSNTSPKAGILKPQHAIAQKQKPESIPFRPPEKARQVTFEPPTKIPRKDDGKDFSRNKTSELPSAEKAPAFTPSPPLSAQPDKSPKSTKESSEIQRTQPFTAPTYIPEQVHTSIINQFGVLCNIVESHKWHQSQHKEQQDQIGELTKALEERGAELKSVRAQLQEKDESQARYQLEMSQLTAENKRLRQEMERRAPEPGLRRTAQACDGCTRKTEQLRDSEQRLQQKEQELQQRIVDNGHLRSAIQSMSAAGLIR